MVNWKSKYLEMKLKYINAKNNLKGGMNSTEDAERLKLLTETFYNVNRVRDLISETAANKNARELYETKKKEILNEITYYFRYLFSEDEEGATLENLMMTLNIEWNDIEKIEEASVEDINRNLLQNKENIIENIQDLVDDY